MSLTKDRANRCTFYESKVGFRLIYFYKKVWVWFQANFRPFQSPLYIDPLDARGAAASKDDKVT